MTVWFMAFFVLNLASSTFHYSGFPFMAYCDSLMLVSIKFAIPTNTVSIIHCIVLITSCWYHAGSAWLIIHCQVSKIYLTLLLVGSGCWVVLGQPDLSFVTVLPQCVMLVIAGCFLCWVLGQHKLSSVALLPLIIYWVSHCHAVASIVIACLNGLVIVDVIIHHYFALSLQCVHAGCWWVLHLAGCWVCTSYHLLLCHYWSHIGQVVVMLWLPSSLLAWTAFIVSSYCPCCCHCIPYWISIKPC